MMKIDFVIPWVDGGDEKWIEKKNTFLDKKNMSGSGINRYRDWDNLKYWFRGVEKFAPWVNKVFFITCGQCPDWLNINNDKLVLVDHKDYIPQEYLPTFSSHPIELNMHKIESLSEHFVYFNDDCFLIGKTDVCDFFSSEGLPCDMFVEDPPVFEIKDVFNDIIVNNMVLVNSNFDRQKVLKEHKKKLYSKVNKKSYIKNKCLSLMKRHKFFGIEFSHLPQPFLKSMFDEVWADNYDVLNETCNNKFRSRDDVNQYVIKYYQLLKGKFEPYNWRKTGIVYHLYDSEEENNITEACKDITYCKYKMICLNDARVSDFESAKERINLSLQTILPEKSSFEK